MIWLRRRSGASTLIFSALLFLCGTLLVPISSEAQGLGRILGGAVGGSVLRSATAIGSDRRFVIVQPRLAIAEARRAGSVTHLSLDRDRNLLLVILADGSARWWDIDRGIERGAVRGQRIVAGLIRGGGLAADILAVRADGSSALFRLDGSLYPLSERVADFDRGARSTAVADSGAMAYRSKRDGAWSLRTSDGERFALRDAASDALPVFSVDGHKVAYLADRGRAVRVMRLGSQGLEPVGLLSGCSKSTRITAAHFTPAGGRIVLADARGNLCLWDVSGVSAPRLLFSVRTGLSGPVRTLALDREGRLAAAGNGRNAVEMWPVAGRIERASSVALQMRSAAALALDTDRGWLFAGGENGTVAIHDFRARSSEQRSRPIASLISTKDGWSVLDSAGRFDGSQNGIDALSWAGEAQEGGARHELPVDSFSESHYEPGLLAKLDGPASGLLNDTATDIPQSGYVRPPDVSIDIGKQDAAGRLRVTVRTESGYPTGSVAGLRLYHNGKLVLDGEGNATLQTVVRLVPGENRIRAVAVGPDGVEGRPATRIATLAGPQLPPDLNVLAIGINDYANPAWELFYPRNDAETLVSALRDRGTRLLAENGRPAFASVRAETLLDRSARKDAIESLLSRSESDAQDVLVLYFAGHGYALEGERGWDWYLLPYTREWRRRTDSLEEFEDLIRANGLSARHLMSLLTRTPAQRVFLILDSCYSGAVVEAVEGMVAPDPVPGDDAATQKVLRQIARIGGLHVLAASRAHETATELQLEPHGALTYLVLEGVKGDADANGDRSVTVREVIDYAATEMPNLADRLSQQPISQKPLGYSKGADFAVVGRPPTER